MKTSECRGRYGVSKEAKKKKKELQTSSTNTDRVNEKLLNMEHGQKKNAPLHGFLYIPG
jgi:hypothetical protein